MDKCKDCQMPIEHEEQTCSCNGSLCTHCCQCEPGCGCNCKEE